MSAVEVHGSIAEIEAETQAVLDAQRARIQDGRIGDRHWFVVLIERADAVLRRRRTTEGRRRARI